MRREYNFYVYIIASETGTLYIGVTNNLVRRVNEHQNGQLKGFTSKYGCKKLIYYETYNYVYDAFAREKQLKKWSRSKKQTLIKASNPHWEDLSIKLVKD